MIDDIRVDDSRVDDSRVDDDQRSLRELLRRGRLAATADSST